MLAILDIDGTLVDTNYHHTLAWFRAFRQHGLVLPIWQIHRHIGMGGDQMIEALTSSDVETRLGDSIRDAESVLYMELIGEVQLMHGARELIDELKQRGHQIVFASSAKAAEVDHYLELLDARGLADGWTTAADVQATKPHPDLLQAALNLVEARPQEAVMIGDTPWDAEAAHAAKVPMLAVLTGGFNAVELQEANVAAVYTSVGELRDQLDDSILSG
jgi:HAD superfamily hydrolase (TIGR01509 family)